MVKKFVGLDGLKHFWTKVKTWIAGQITAEVTAKIAEIVANAPEDLDTLKEIADWISTHANDASAMNTQINTNKNDIAALQTSVAGKADTGHTHTKSQITDFAHTHDDRYFTETEVTNMLDGKSNTGHNHDDRYYTESEVDTKLGKKSDTGHKHSADDITSGVLSVARGGTGVTTQADINKAFIGNLDIGNSDVTDSTEFVSSYASDNGFADSNAVNTPYKRQFIKVWNYIKGKISSVLGLTKDNYGGTAATILDYARGTPIKVRWGGDGINSAEWYPAFNADGSAIEPIHRNNIRVGTADYAKNMYLQTFDLTSLDKTKFYPAFGFSGDDFAEVAIHSPSASGSAEYNQNRIHFDISTNGWNDTPPTLNIREYACYDNNEITIGCIGRGVHNGAWAIWLRGGLTYYCYTRNCDLSLKTSDYTYGDETYTVGTNYYGGSNTNVSVWFTPQSTIKEGAYSSRPITAPSIKATTNFIGNLTGNVTGNVTGSSGSCTGNSATATTADKAVSVVDYGDTSRTIKIGYGGAGATAENLSHIAGYLTGGTQIKDVSKSVLQSWLGLSNYLPLSGGTVTGKLDVKTAGIRIPISQPNDVANGDIWIG